MEQLFSIAGSEARPARRVTLKEAGLYERAHLQEWILEYPQVLGDDVLIVTSEFDRWETSGGRARADRLDVLGLHSDGRTVVAELKRDAAPDTVQMQALKYAAMVSRFTVDRLAEEHARFVCSRGGRMDEREARERLLGHAPELSEESLRRPRVALVAGSFPPAVTATAVWLNEMGVTVTLIQVQAYEIGGGEGAEDHQLLLSANQIYPVKSVEDFTISPAQARVRDAEARTTGTRAASAVQRLVAAGSVPDGTGFILKLRRMGAAERETVEEWLAHDPARSRASWFNDASGPLRWDADGESYLPSTLVRTIVNDAGYPSMGSYEGTVYWVDDQGRTIADLAAQLPNGQ